MKIIELQVENVKGIRAIELHPSQKGLVNIAGETGAGKSSVLDAIEMLLGGGKGLPAKPVRRGEQKGRILGDLGDYIVTRTITPDGGGTIRVQDKDLKRVSSPQEILDGFLGKLTFDPMEFQRQKPDKRAETLRALLGLDFKQEDAEIKRIYDERTEVNREIRKLETMLGAAKEFPDAPKEEESTSAILEEQQSANVINTANERKRREFETWEKRLTQAEQDIDRQSKTIEQMRADLKRAEENFAGNQKTISQEKTAIEKMRPEIAALKDVAVEPFRDKLKQVEDNNRKVRANKVRADIRKSLKENMEDADEKTSAIEKLESAKRRKIAETKFPVEGLSISDTNEIEYKGLPFDQINTGEKLRISVAMGMAMNPKLRVLLVRQGNDMDDRLIAQLAKMAEEADYQVWLERINPIGETAIIIEDGGVKGTIPGTIEPIEPKKQETLI